MVGALPGRASRLRARGRCPHWADALRRRAASLRTRPERDGGDGFFAARLVTRAERAERAPVVGFGFVPSRGGAGQ